MVHLTVIHGRGFCRLVRHSDQAGVHARLGIDQELAGNDDAFSFFQSRKNFGHAVRLEAGFNLCRPESPIGQRQNDAFAPAGADDRLGGNGERFAVRVGCDFHAGVHIGLQREVRIVVGQANLAGSRLSTHARIDIVDFSDPLAIRGGEWQIHRSVLPSLDPGNLAFEQIDYHPNSGQVGDAHDGRARLDIHALAHVEIGDVPVPRRLHRE